MNVVSFYYLQRFIKSVSCTFFILFRCTPQNSPWYVTRTVLDLPPDARLGCFPGKADGYALTVIESTLLLSLTSKSWTYPRLQCCSPRSSLVATVIMIAIAIRRRRVMGGKNRLLQIFYQDGIFYFISISGTATFPSLVLYLTASF